ncbi:MAG: hypothetical protein ABIY50_12370 [Ignavibacteria bacterium]
MAKRTLKVLRPLSELIPQKLKRFTVEFRRQKTQLKPTSVKRFDTKEGADLYMSKNPRQNYRLVVRGKI